ncbi:hypothetical protein AAFF_G00388750 [Aldrovandia affinis]|uniref:C-type lectin domain-containing protein n=1 Tax=Aldrovandia affinis TaxID=143900 RepID=A0AAD7VY77_9TELE|nr:hypothetical protein AAFF_G00388750 [Aldrovandia affinis]
MFPFFCYDGVHSQDDPNSTQTALFPDNLILVRENKSWDEALSFCRQHYGDLVSAPTEQVQRWVNRRAQNASTPHVWLGLNYSCKLHFWFWLDGTIVGMEEEARECRGKRAIQSGKEKSWVVLHETEKLNFICNKCGVDVSVSVPCRNAHVVIEVKGQP